MANTVIQIKRSTATGTPPNGSLTGGEQAYSYSSNTLFIGTSDGTGIIPIGGKYYVDVATQAYNQANSANQTAIAAFNYANTLSSAGGLTAFSNIAVGGTFLVADSNADVLTIQSGNGISITADAAQDSFNVTLSTTGVTSGTYGGSETVTPTFTVDAYGRISFAGNVTVTNAAAVAVGANAYATAVGAGSNNYLLAVIAGANTAVGTGANAYATAVGAGANAYMIAIQNGSNTAVGAGANAYSDATFVKLISPGQTITGNLAVTGSLTVSGNAFSIDTQTLKVSDPLIYLAGNNYVSDIVDIGFVGNYVNATGSNVHTGVFRDATTKEYYVFEGYDKEPEPNHIDTAGNNFTIAVLNATIRTSNLILGGANAILTINSVGVAANDFASATIAGANAAVGAGANAYATAVGAGSNNYLLAVISGANTAVGAGANAYATAVGAGSNNYLLAVIAGANTAVGAGANAYAALVGAAANTNAANASYINTGTLLVNYGGTGLNTIANNGVMFGFGTGAVRTAATSTEGHVLQANQFGTPFFGMLDGGSF